MIARDFHGVFLEQDPENSSVKDICVLFLYLKIIP